MGSPRKRNHDVFDNCNSIVAAGCLLCVVFGCAFGQMDGPVRVEMEPVDVDVDVYEPSILDGKTGKLQEPGDLGSVPSDAKVEKLNAQFDVGSGYSEVRFETMSFTISKRFVHSASLELETTERTKKTLSDETVWIAVPTIQEACQSSPERDYHFPNKSMKGEGYFSWSEFHSFRRCSRIIDIHIWSDSPATGLVVHVEQLAIGIHDTFEMYAGETKSTLHQLGGARFLTVPLLVPHNRVSIYMNTSQHSRNTPNRFVIFFAPHPLDLLPLPAYFWSNISDAATRSSELYKCAPPYVVPPYIKCDMVQQCEHGEDEPKDCEYRSKACGSWIPYRGQCLKIVLLPRTVCSRPFLIDYASKKSDKRFGWKGCSTANPDSGTVRRDPTSHKVLPGDVEKLCREKFDAVPAKLVDKSGRETVARILRLMTTLNDELRENLVVGLTKARPASRELNHLYRFVWQWGGYGEPLAYDLSDLQTTGALAGCAFLSVTHSSARLVPSMCDDSHNVTGYVCMRQSGKQTGRNLDLMSTGVNLTSSAVWVNHFPAKECTDGSRAQVFHPCPVAHDDSGGGQSPGGIPLSQCTVGHNVHYTLVCDGHADCADGSDEESCARSRLFSSMTEVFICVQDLQVIPVSLRCNGMADCFDGSDETDCTTCSSNAEMIRCPGFGCVPRRYVSFLPQCEIPSHQRLPSPIYFFKHWPSEVEMDGYGLSHSVPSASPYSECSETHFRCQDGSCIPTFLLNNKEQDCKSGEDENIPQHLLTCPGFYRCLGSGSCVHSDYICDGIHHCPLKDDERYCHLHCPLGCTCEGHAFTCKQMFENATRYLEVRYLDFSGSKELRLGDIHTMQQLQFLNLSFCGLTNVSLSSMPNIKILDLSFNEIRFISGFVLQNLQVIHLNLSGNPLGLDFDAFPSLVLSAGFQSLTTLSLKNVGLESLDAHTFAALPQIKKLDIRKNRLKTLNRDTFSKVWGLSVLQTDDPRLCCSIFHAQPLELCDAPVDGLSSCGDLLRSDVFRVSLWVFSTLALTGNSGVFVYRLFLEREGSSPSYRVLVVNLCVADLLMGVYLAIVGSADARFRGVYVAVEESWRASGLCQAAGFIALLSCEISAFFICIITVDRILVLRFPFNSKLRLTRLSSVLVCSLAWGIGLTLATIPLIKADWNFYGHTGICVPLPFTQGDFQGQHFTFAVFIILNFSLFLVIGCGQAFIFATFRRASMEAKQEERRSQETLLARRLFVIAFSDFLCWFPVGVMGLLASQDTPIPRDANVWAAVFVLPLNSALNPFLYTLNTMLERRAERRLKTRVERMMNKLHVELRSWPRDKVEDLFRFCLKAKLLEKKSFSVTEVEGQMSGGQTDSVPASTLSESSAQTEITEILTSHR